MNLVYVILGVTPCLAPLAKVRRHCAYLAYFDHIGYHSKGWIIRWEAIEGSWPYEEAVKDEITKVEEKVDAEDKLKEVPHHDDIFMY